MPVVVVLPGVGELRWVPAALAGGAVVKHADVDLPPDLDHLPEHVQQLAALFLNAWCTIAGPHWHEAGAMRAVYGPGPIRDGLRALPLLAQVDGLHQPVSWATNSDVVVCSCGGGSYDSCPTARVLRGNNPPTLEAPR